MTKTICPTCGTKCRMIKKLCSLVDCRSGNHLIEAYEPLPQPDLTKLKEVFIKWKDVIPDTTSILYHKFANVALPDVWQAIKEVLDAETSDSDHNS